MMNSYLKKAALILSVGLPLLSVAQPYQIGHTTIDFVDPARNNRAIQTEVYYPAATAGNDVAGANGTFPYVVFGHGFVMAWDAYTNLWEEFVPRGYIMVFPRTEGSIIGTDHQQFGWDLQFLVNAIYAENTVSGSFLNGHVAPAAALMGHSMGGGASFLAADSLTNNGNTLLKTLVGLAPAESSTNGVSSIRSAKSITVPAVIFSGSNDGVTPAADHHIPMYDSLASACKTFIRITGGGHCYYANSNFNCDFGESTSSTGISITREQQQQVAYDFVNPWLDYTLKGDCDGLSMFQDSVTGSSRITSNQMCSTNPKPSITASGSNLTSSITGTAYTWYLNGTVISGATSQSYNASQSGSYVVEVAFANGCPVKSDPYAFGTVGIHALANTGVSLYPNPVLDELTVTVNTHSGKTSLNVYSVEGRKVLSVNLNSERNTIALSHLNSGVYIAEVSGDNGVSRVRLVKE